MKPDDETNELARILDNEGIKIYPGSQLPGRIDYHVCTTRPKPGGSNHKGTCSKCGAPVFFQDSVDTKKICVPCYITLTKTVKHKNVSTENAIIQARLTHKRN